MPNSKPPLPLLLAALTLAVYFVGAVEFMLAPMLTPLAAAFRVPLSSAAWLVSGYALSYAALAPFIGLLSDRLGRRRTLLPALLLFAADALVLTLAPTLSLAIAFRMLGGAAGAALTPTVFALLAETTRPEKQAGAMGLVLFGLTLGAATGPTLAGTLTDHFGWRAPFLSVAAGCLGVFALASWIVPAAVARPARGLKASATRLLEPAILRANLCKGAWLGATIAGFLISGEALRARYGLGTGAVGSALAVFGAGLAIGNLAIGRLGPPQRVLPAAIGLIFVALCLFFAAPLPLAPALILLGACGFGCGLAAPANTAIQASRAGADAGFVLASSETLNNGLSLVLTPIVTRWIVDGSNVAVAIVLGGAVAVGGAIGLVDLLVGREQIAVRVADGAETG